MLAAGVKLDAARRNVVFLAMSDDTAFPVELFGAKGDWAWDRDGYTRQDRVASHFTALTALELQGFRELKAARASARHAVLTSRRKAQTKL